MSKKFIGAFVGLTMIFGMASSANAALSWEFGFVGPAVDGFAGTGSFTLGGDDGGTSDLLAFEFSGTCGDNGSGPIGCSFTLDDVAGGVDGGNWLIGDGWIFDFLEIGASEGTAFDGFRLEITNVSMTLDCFFDGNDCSVAGMRREFATGSGMFLTHAVPEPSSLGLFLLGLISLVAAGRLARRRRLSGGSPVGV